MEAWKRNQKHPHPYSREHFSAAMRSHSPAPLAAAPTGVSACAKADTADAARLRGEELHSLHSFPRSCCLPGLGHPALPVP